jgi:hypothetical protein
MRVKVFPALLKQAIAQPSGDILLVGDDASCFFHPKKRAVTPCAICGRFLCALCDVELNGQHLCSSCIDAGKRKRQMRNLENRRTLYDTIALYLAIVPMLLFWPVFVTAPVVVFLTIKYWKAPTSIVPRTKARFVVALALAGLEIVGCTVFIYALAVS